jgi:hypothetical protein
VQPFSGASEVKFFGYGNEIAQVPKFHRKIAQRLTPVLP